MNELIKVNYSSDRPTTSARDLWEFLGRPYTEYLKWFNRYREYGFIENQDYRALRVKVRTAQGNEMDVADHEITIDMAKELCMLQKSEKGKVARRYFIELEKQWNSPEAVMARALQMADRKIAALQAKIEEDEPKVLFADSVVASKDSILIRELAKILKQNGIDIGEKRLFEYLRANGYLIRKHGADYNTPTQKAMELGLFEVKKTVITHSDGRTTVRSTPMVTGKGQVYFVNDFKKKLAMKGQGEQKVENA